MSAALYRSPQFLAASHLSRGTAWTLREAVRSLLTETRLEALPEHLLSLALACLPQSCRKAALGALLATGLAARTPAGLVLVELDPHRVVVEPLPPVDGPSAAALRKRRQRERQRDTAPASRPPVTPPGHGVTNSVTAPVTSSVTERDIERDNPRDMADSPGFLTKDSSVTAPVTSLAYAPACEENSPSLPPSTFFKKEGEEGEENSPLPPASRRSVTLPASPALPSALAPIAGPMAAVLASIPGSPLAAPTEPAASLEERHAAALALWAQTFGPQPLPLEACDERAVWEQVNAGATQADFKRVFSHAATNDWYHGGDGTRFYPRLICGKRWRDCLDKGPRGAAPQSQRRPAPAASPPSTPRPVAPPQAPLPPPNAAATLAGARSVLAALNARRSPAQRSEAAE